MYKEGDRVKTIEKIQPHTKEGPIAVDGVIAHVTEEEVQVTLDVQTEYGRRHGFGTRRYFKLADLLSYDIMRLRVGDKITTTHALSVYGASLTPGDMYTVEDGLGPCHVLARRDRDGQTMTLERGACTKLTTVKEYRPEDKRKPEKPLGWTFRATDSTFDGARVLRELDEAGADYAVIEWQDSWVAVIHERVVARAASLGVTKLLGRSWTIGKVAQLNPLTMTPEGFPYRPVFNNNGACSGIDGFLVEVKAMVDELARLETEAKKFRVHVAYGKVGE